MHNFLSPLSLFLGLLTPALSATLSNHGHAVRATKTPAFFLAGDSTTAVQSTGGGGWGDGFLSFLKDPAWGINYGHNGRTTVSFVEGGDWDEVLGSVQESKGEYDCYVTIQFGHNDQKEKAHISHDEYQANLENLAKEVKSAGGTPILVTPLTRRSFSSAHSVSDSLHDERLLTIAAADATDTFYIDLNKASIEYVNAIGEKDAHAYNLHDDDNTHLNDHGSVVFGRLVADLILGRPPTVLDESESGDWNIEEGWAAQKGLPQWFKSDDELTSDIWHGIAA